jgi:hypothetical protein
VSDWIIAGKGKVRYDVILVVFVNNTKGRSVEMKTRCKIGTVETGGVATCGNFSCNISTDRIRIVCSRQVIGRHVSGSDWFIVPEFETVADASWDINEVIEDTGLCEI